VFSNWYFVFLLAEWFGNDLQWKFCRKLKNSDFVRTLSHDEIVQLLASVIEYLSDDAVPSELRPVSAKLSEYQQQFNSITGQYSVFDVSRYCSIGFVRFPSCLLNRFRITISSIHRSQGQQHKPNPNLNPPAVEAVIVVTPGCDGSQINGSVENGLHANTFSGPVARFSKNHKLIVKLSQIRHSFVVKLWS